MPRVPAGAPSSFALPMRRLAPTWGAPSCVRPTVVLSAPGAGCVLERRHGRRQRRISGFRRTARRRRSSPASPALPSPSPSPSCSSSRYSYARKRCPVPVRSPFPCAGVDRRSRRRAHGAAGAAMHGAARRRGAPCGWILGQLGERSRSAVVDRIPDRADRRQPLVRRFPFPSFPFHDADDASP